MAMTTGQEIEVADADWRRRYHFAANATWLGSMACMLVMFVRGSAAQGWIGDAVIAGMGVFSVASLVLAAKAKREAR